MSTPAAPNTALDYVSYWTIVWTQFRKNGPSWFAWRVIQLLVAIAVGAPLLSARSPFLWSDEQGIAFPWFRALLFNRNVFDNGVDLFFNLLLVLSPFALLSFHLLGRRVAGIDPRKATRMTRLHHWTWAVGLVVAYLGLMAIEPRIAEPDYRQMAADGASATWLFPPLRIHFEDTLHGLSGPGISHLLGVDTAGRDIFVRLVYGTRVSLSVGVIAVGIYITIGSVLGAWGGFFGGRADMIVQRLVEIFLCFPSFFLILTFIGFLDRPNIGWVMVIIGLVGWTGPARLVRGEFLRLRNIDFVAAARALGLSNLRIIFRHILPNAIGPVLVNATFGVASAVLAESSLSFLGFGDPTLPSWGRILAFGRETGDTAMMLIAGAAIFVTVSSFNLAGEGIRDALDPKLRK